MTIDVTTLFTSATAARILSVGLELAEALGLNTTSWREGDPEHTLYSFLADTLSDREDLIGELIQAGFLSSATGSWLTLVAQDLFGVTRTAASPSTPSVTFDNTGGGAYSKGIGEVIVKASSTGELFRNTEALTLASGPGVSATIAFEAENAGAAGSVALDDIDTIVSTMLGVEIDTSTASTGVDEQSDASLRSECSSSIGSVSVNGPPDAYNAVCLDSDLTGETTLTRASTTENAVDGTVTVYVATSSGAPAGGAVTAAQTAVELWATPACITPTVIAASEYSQAVTQTVNGTDIPSGFAAALTTLFTSYLSGVDIAGVISMSALTAITHDYLVAQGATDVSVITTVPAASVALSAGQVPVIGAVSVTEV